MIITTETACGRTVKSPQKDVRVYPWGSGVVCCGACQSVVDSRWSWYEVYA